MCGLLYVSHVCVCVWCRGKNKKRRGRIVVAGVRSRSRCNLDLTLDFFKTMV